LALLACTLESIGEAQETFYSPQRLSHLGRVVKQAGMVGELADTHRRNEQLRAANQRGYLDTLHQVEIAAVPFPDDPPIRYPDDWDRRVALRRETPASRPDSLSPRLEAEGKIEATLESPTRCQFVETPLADILEYFSDYHDVPIEVDHRAVLKAGMGAHVPITRNLQGITLRSALEQILCDLGLAHVVSNEAILITSKEVADTYVKTRACSVGNIVRPLPCAVSAPCVVVPHVRPVAYLHSYYSPTGVISPYYSTGVVSPHYPTRVVLP